MIKVILNRLRKILNQREWRRLNSNNKAVLGSVSNYNLISVGNNSYGVLNVINHSDNYELKIGNFCSIATNVQFIVCGEHRTDTVSTFPLKVHFMGEKFEAFSNGNIIVEDDVWIGTNAIIMSGVTLGKGSIIAAGSVVTKSVPAYTIVGGIPAKVIKERFSEEIKQLLMELDFSKLTDEFIKNNIDLLYSDLENKDNQIALRNLVNELNKKEIK
ncbi:CatB-related O-acetyltransferase [Streptococcus parauberis]|uniref:Acetyltransferase n=1 Tax=Streptococcus parauberis TaxID=1348 RepID=A0A0S3TGE6_9STRE|nr:CatB-related O-acetyltransferase [Streptococcus parauberis]UWM86169.1 CatB-related O-acetyltransferase [Streptococcus parauberis]UWM88140.1 CatB-related O-acetyltransferase [Streptococcus parauberis]WEM58977.1 CatB-related O-acetyltransferase [Streptococcus parauberis]BAU04060.1 acetyltransferase [Streptococcus parauberis]BAU04097.1 acetyltransferase [Streptococcus parauberis]